MGYEIAENEENCLDRSAEKHFLVLPWKAEDSTARKMGFVPSLEDD